MSDPLWNLDWDDLKVFLVSVRCQSVSGAAKELKLSHSTVSRRLSRLEHVLGSALFERNRDGLFLTTFGRSVLTRAEEVVAGINNLRSELSGDGPTGGIIRFATMEGIASLYLASRLADFQASYPSVRLELLTTPRQVHISHREADMFLSFFQPHGDDMVSKKVGAFEIGLYASPGYIEQHGLPQTPDDLSKHHYVGYLDQFVELDTVRWLEELVKRPRIVFWSNSMIAQRSAARGGLGIVALPHFALAENESLVRIMPELSARRSIWITVHHDLRNLPRIVALQKYFKELFETDASYLAGEIP
ncbi:LysR family transcriptional regulator [Roseibium aggregatum]|uniref:HTH-type transcriptional regulator GltR n=1 Tax=Roseibium aggregatum TaxID=187304 RepID=A0A0M6YDS8_9HYPH|nr:LysR family transcriptional regulator [Roseibium aggregatum]CTQ47397.1 HTH-type transcriptional regulator GltR [Roseibium aggregatum]